MIRLELVQTTRITCSIHFSHILRNCLWIGKNVTFVYIFDECHKTIENPLNLYFSCFLWLVFDYFENGRARAKKKKKKQNNQFCVISPQTAFTNCWHSNFPTMRVSWIYRSLAVCFKCGHDWTCIGEALLYRCNLHSEKSTIQSNGNIQTFWVRVCVCSFIFTWRGCIVFTLYSRCVRWCGIWCVKQTKWLNCKRHKVPYCIWFERPEYV